MTEADGRPADPWLSTEQFATRLGVDPATARNWRRAGYGPVSVPFGAKRKYRLSTVEAWEDEQEKAAAKEHARKGLLRAAS